MEVGFIGLGIMGNPMAKNLIKAGHDLVVCDIDKEAVEELRKCGARSAGSNEEVARQCDVIIIMVPNSPQVRDICLGEHGIIQGGGKGTVVLDMSSIDPLESKSVASELASKEIEMCDCPVSGGEPKAIDGTLSVMCGGKRAVFERYYDLLCDMAASVVYVGPIGSGNVAKLANQMIVASNIAILAEALTFAKKSGTDPERVYEAIRGGLAGSVVMDAKAPMMLAGNYNPGFRVELHIKDIANAMNAAHSINMPVPITVQLMEILQNLSVYHEEKNDHAGIVKYYERLSNVSIVREQ